MFTLKNSLMLCSFFHETAQDPEKYSVLNIGPDDAGIKVSEIAELVISRVSPNAKIKYGAKKHRLERGYT